MMVETEEPRLGAGTQLRESHSVGQKESYGLTNAKGWENILYSL